MFLANHSAVIQRHPTKGAEIYCCIQAGGILAATIILKCAVRGAHRSVLDVVHAACVLLVVPFLLP